MAPVERTGKGGESPGGESLGPDDDDVIDDSDGADGGGGGDGRDGRVWAPCNSRVEFSKCV
jgi:hypothetical protein